MGKRWAAGALLALALLLAAAASPLAGARGIFSLAKGTEPPEAREPRTAPAEEEGNREVIELEEGLVLVETASPVSSLGDMRAVQVTDVPEKKRDAACYAVFRGLLATEEDGAFRGDEPVSRGEAAAALYQLSGVLVRADECRYEDVPEEYRDAVAWAGSAGISGGVSENRFAPFSPVTRSQLAVMLHRFAAWRGEDTDSETVVEDSVPAYAEEALGWVLERELYAGMTDHGLYPQLPVSRLQLAEILVRTQRERDPLAAALDLPEPEAESLSLRRHEELQEAVSRAARRHGAVGVQVAVVENGAVTDTYSWGWAVQGVTPMSGQHKLRTASLSKVVVGLAAMLLREEGTVDLDADISAYWGKDARNPWRPNDPVTIRNMLSHTSTILNNDSLSRSFQSVRDLLGTSAGYGGGTPGNMANWSYNNYAFSVLGQTLELASGRYLDDVLEERIFGPLGLDGNFAAGELDQPDLVTPLYQEGALRRSAGSVRGVHRWAEPGASGAQFAGGFTSSARDMAKLAALLAGDGCFGGVRLMDAESVALMESCGPDPAPDGAYQALPLRRRPDLYGRDELYYHTGSAYGVYNLFSYDPASGDGVVVLTMGADGGRDSNGIYAVCGEISQAVYNAVK